MGFFLSVASEEFWIGCHVMDNKKHPRQTRTIFYLRCAAYFRLLPRTRTQKLRAQTHSRRRAMLTPMTKIDLPSCLWMFFYCPIYMMAPGEPRVQYSYETFCVRADINEKY